MSTQNFSELLVSARTAAGIKQAELARYLGLDCSEMCKYEKGEKVPYNDRLILICEALGLDVKAAAAARALSIDQDTGKGKGNRTTRTIAIVHARSCKRSVNFKTHLGSCHCSGGKFSSVAALLRVCLARQEKGDQRCQRCAVLESGGNDKEELKKCNITIMETK